MWTEIVIWENAMDWSIKTDGDNYWHRAVDDEEWHQGPPPGMTEGDVECLFLTTETARTSWDSKN